MLSTLKHLEYFRRMCEKICLLCMKILKTLSGKTHQVYTGVCLKWTEKKLYHLFAEITTVTFRNLDEKDILHYIESCPPFDKAGAYGIQDWSAVFVKEIKGC